MVNALKNMGIFGALASGTLASVISIAISVMSAADFDDSGEQTYKTMWRLLNVVVKVFTTIFMAIVFFQTNIFTTKTKSILTDDYGWRGIIKRTLIANGLHTVLCIANFAIPWKKGAHVHAIRIIIEIINIALTFGIGFLGFSRPLFSHNGLRNVEHTMKNNKMYKFVQTFLNGRKVPKSDLRGMQMQANVMVNAMKTANQQFGERQKRRNN